MAMVMVPVQTKALETAQRLLTFKVRQTSLGHQVLLHTLLGRATAGDVGSMWGLLETMDRMQLLTDREYRTHRARLVRLDFNLV